jgi:integrase
MSQQRPPKPYDTFPLFPHAKGYWCKKIDGAQVSFGKWAWPDRSAYERSWRDALDAYKRHQEAIALGLELRGGPQRIALGTLSDAFLTFKHSQVEKGQIGSAMFSEYRQTINHFRDFVGRETRLAALEGDARLITGYVDEVDRFGWHAFNKRVTLVRGMFRWAADPLGGNILDRPFRLVGLLKKRSEKLRRRSKRLRVAEHGADYLPAGEIRAMLSGANSPMRAMILLAYFGAYGNTDCADLPKNAINRNPDPALGLPPGWAVIQFPRPKTEIDRACVVPPVVVEAIDAVLADRPEPRQSAWRSLVFITRHGYPYVRDKVHRNEAGQITKSIHIDAVSLVYPKLRERVWTCPQEHCHELDASGAVCTACRHELAPVRAMGFYALRHTAITDASGAADVDVLSRWQGHSLPGMRRFYVEQIEGRKLVAIAERLHQKLFGKPAIERAELATAGAQAPLARAG